MGRSAARWLVPEEAADGTPRGRPVDVVADLLVLDPRTRLRGRGDDRIRALAADVEGLAAMGVAAPSGRALLDVLVADPETRSALEPSLDIDALLADAPVSDRTHDRTVRLAEAMLARADQHRAGEVDLHLLVAPIGVDRHAGADELETIVAVATDGLSLPAGADPAIAVTTGGWVGASPVELFLTAATGVLQGGTADVAGAALYGWMERCAADPADPWWTILSTTVEVDAPGLLQQAAARAGSDHPDVAGAVLAELIALRHPLS